MPRRPAAVGAAGGRGAGEGAGAEGAAHGRHVAAPSHVSALGPWGSRYHRNMVGLMPTWDHMLRNGLLDGYDWVINSELRGGTTCYDHLYARNLQKPRGTRGFQPFFIHFHGPTTESVPNRPRFEVGSLHEPQPLPAGHCKLPTSPPQGHAARAPWLLARSLSIYASIFTSLSSFFIIFK